MSWIEEMLFQHLWFSNFEWINGMFETSWGIREPCGLRDPILERMRLSLYQLSTQSTSFAYKSSENQRYFDPITLHECNMYDDMMKHKPKNKRVNFGVQQLPLFNLLKLDKREQATAFERSKLKRIEYKRTRKFTLLKRRVKLSQKMPVNAGLRKYQTKLDLKKMPNNIGLIKDEIKLNTEENR